MRLVKWLSAVFMLLMVSFSHAADKSSFTLTIEELIKQKGFTLQGIGGARELYLPLMPNWDVSRIHLHLILTRDKSPNVAAISAFIKDFPISSINLPVNMNGEMVWDIDILPKYIDKNLVTLALRRGWNENGTTCNRYADPGSWVAVDGSSTITYDYTYKNYQPNLAKFPEPFIMDPSLSGDKVLLLLPDGYHLQELQSAYYVANALQHKKTWRGLTIKGDIFSQVSLEDKSQTHVIIVGISDVIAKLIETGNLPITFTNGLLQDKDGKPLSDETGVIMLTNSPWNPNYSMLIVTANGQQGVLKAAQALQDPRFGKTVLFDKYALIEQAEKRVVTPIDWEDTSFAELGYQDMVVKGSGENKINYEINLPSNRAPQGMDIALEYMASPLLSTRNSSFIALYANGFPVSGIRISAGDNQKQVWKFHIEKENLVAGKNNLSFILNLKFYNYDCSPDDLSLAWAVIYANSSISVKLGERTGGITFGNFESMKQNVSVYLPKDKGAFSPAELISLMMGMAENIFNIENINVYYNDVDIRTTSADTNVIYIGNINENTLVSENRHHFPFCYLNSRLVVKQSLQPYLHVSDEVPVALIQLTDSPFNSDQLFLSITANDIHGYKSAIDLLFNPVKNAYLKGNAALVYKDATFTSIDTTRLEMKAKNTKLITMTRRSVMIGFITFVAVFFGLLLAVILYRRAKKYFGRSQG